MEVRTRYVVFGGTGVLIVGFFCGLVAFHESRPSMLAEVQEGPSQFRYLPADASVVAFANVRDVIYSGSWQRLRETRPELDGEREFQEQTGIDIENDIDEVVACLVPKGSGTADGLVILSGRFSTTRLEALARARGATLGEYEGRRLVKTVAGESEVAMAFVEDGVVALGSERTIRRAIDLVATGDDITSNALLMSMFGNIESGSDAWVIGRLDDSTVPAWLPEVVATQTQKVAAFAATVRINGGVSGMVTVETRDDEAGQNLHDILQGFLVLTRMQTISQPELRTLLDSLKLSTLGTAVSLSFTFPLEIAQQFLSATAEQDE